MSWGGEVAPLDDATVELFAGLSLSDVLPEVDGHASGDHEEDNDNNNNTPADDDDDSSSKSIGKTVRDKEELLSSGVSVARAADIAAIDALLSRKRGERAIATVDDKGKGEASDDEDSSESEELCLHHSVRSSKATMRTEAEIHKICRDRWDDLYPEDADESAAIPFEDAQLKWDVSWYKFKLESDLSIPVEQAKGGEMIVPVGLNFGSAIALRGEFERDVQKAQQECYAGVTEFFRQCAEEAWDMTSLSFIEGRFSFAMECKAVDEEHAKKISDILRKQRKAIVRLAERVQEELEKADASGDAAVFGNRYKRDKLREAHTAEVKPREIDQLIVHDLERVARVTKMARGNTRIVTTATFALSEPFEEFVGALDEGERKQARKREKKRKANRKKRKKRRAKKDATVVTEELPEDDHNWDVPSPKAQQITPKKFPADLLICSVGLKTGEPLEWKSARTGRISTDGVQALSVDSRELAVSVPSGINIHSLPSGYVTERFYFPSDWRGRTKYVFLSKQFVAAVFNDYDGAIKRHWQLAIFDRATVTGKVVAISTAGYVCSVCAEPTTNSYWVGMSNGTVFCLNWDTNTLDERLCARVMLVYELPVRSLSRVGRQLQCQHTCGTNMIDVQPLRGESVTGMMKRTGHPDFIRDMLVSAVDRRGTIRVHLQQNHSLRITHSAAKGLVRVLVPPDRLSETFWDTTIVKNEEGEDVKKMEEKRRPLYTYFPLDQHICVDEDKITVLYSDASVRVIRSTGIEEKSNSQESANPEEIAAEKGDEEEEMTITTQDKGEQSAVVAVDVVAGDEQDTAEVDSKNAESAEVKMEGN